MASFPSTSSSSSVPPTQDPFPSQPLPEQYDLASADTYSHVVPDSLPVTNSGGISSSVARPIRIPTTPNTRRNPDRVPTPVSGRGDRRGHFFPLTASSSPNGSSHCSTSEEDIPASLTPSRRHHTPHHRSFSLTLSPRSGSLAMMHADRASSRYTPTSPLSPRLQSSARPASPQPSRTRGQASRPMNIPIPKFHPLQYQKQREMSAGNVASSHNPIISYTKSTTESQRLMKERQRELIDKAKMSSRMAASSHGMKPHAPRLYPLGSPKGPVTPLALEEGGDYFLFAGSGKTSPSVSPGIRSDGSVKNVRDGAYVKKASKTDGGRR